MLRNGIIISVAHISRFIIVRSATSQYFSYSYYANANSRSLPSRNLDSRAHLSLLLARGTMAPLRLRASSSYSPVSQHARRGVTAIFTKAKRTMAPCSARPLDRRCLGRALLINRGAITRDLSRIAFSFFLSLRFLFRIYIYLEWLSRILFRRDICLS